MRLTFVSLFTGFGGLDLGLERAGLRCVAQVEIEPAARRVLANHWPRVPRFDDVRTFTRSCLERRVDLVVGGFPCQDISNAGGKAGITGARSGLWGEMLRIIRALRPAYAIVENVSALRARGLDVVLGDLAAGGFDAEWDCLPAAAVGAPHLRDRLFLVAHAKRLGRPGVPFFPSIAPGQSGAWPPAKGHRLARVVGRAQRCLPVDLRVDDGLPGRVERLRGCGNAVVPQLGEWLGRQLGAFHVQFPRPAARAGPPPSPNSRAIRAPRAIPQPPLERPSKAHNLRFKTTYAPRARARGKARPRKDPRPPPDSTPPRKQANGTPSRAQPPRLPPLTRPPISTHIRARSSVH